MKKIILAAILVLWAAVLLFAQPKPKSNKAEAAPTAKEMEALMRQAQEEIDKLDPETKRMMDSMGVKMPSFNEIPQVTDKQLADAYAEEGRVIPSKKTQLIATLPKKILTNTELTAFVKATNAAVVRTITPKSKALGDKVILQFQADKHYGAMIASAANGMWIMGLKEPAVYLMGKATEALPNADNFNNYAAYLTMSGAAHAAIPLLEKLNRTHKKNSTVLNNLGQAWLQLGDGDRANKYLDSAIRVYAYHPQANYTKCLILESEGKIAEAAVALNRSLKHSVTKNKMDKLRQLEKKQSGQKKYYVPRTYFSTSFNLGLYTAVLPTRYTTGVGGADIEAEWKFAREQLSNELAGLDAAIRMAHKQATDELTSLQNKIAQSKGQVSFSPHYMRALNAPSPMDDVYARKFEAEAREDVAYLMEVSKLKADFQKALEKEQERYEMKTPNGSNLGANCAGEVPIIAKFISTANGLHQKHRELRLKAWASDAYMKYNYVTSVAPVSGVALKESLEIKRDFVRKLLELKHEFYDHPACAPKTEVKKLTKKKLPDYDKVNCKTASSLYVPLTGQIVIRCNQMDVIFNPTFLPVKGSWTENFNTDKIEECSLGVTIKSVDLTVSAKLDDNGNFETGKISVGKEINGIDVSVNGEFDTKGFTKGSMELGIDGSMSLIPKALADAAPVDISLKGELGVGIEVGPEGISDLYVKESTKLDVASSMEADFDTSGAETEGFINEVARDADIQLTAPKVSAGASISADNRVGVNSGYSGKSGGSLSGITIK